MSLNIQLADGTLKEINEVTKEKIITALDYIPANEEDLPNITDDDESRELTIEDASGNVIARIDEEGIHSTEVEAKGILLGKTVSEHTNNSSIHVTSSEKSIWNNKSDFSGFYEDLIDKPNITPEDDDKSLTIADSNGNVIMKVDEEGIHSTEVELGDIKVRETLINHTSDTNIHITSSERNKWNNKSDFSGAYEDLIGKPNIIPEDEDKSLVINDNNGNTILRVDENGLETTTVTAKSMVIDNVDINVKLNEHIDDNIKHITSDERTKWNNKSDFSGNYTDLQDAPNITPEDDDKSLSIMDEAGNTIAKFDFNGLETTQVTAKSMFINGVSVESKLDEHTTDIGELQTRLNALADSDDITLDQLSEIVAYIKSNKSLIDSITTNKVSVSDIIDNLTTAVVNKPLSANQGVVIKSLIDGLRSDLNAHINNTTSHITSDERTKWNNKSDFSGNYVDLVDAPNITPESEDKSLTISDESGNVIVKIDANGLETTQVTVRNAIINGNDIESTINEHKEDAVAHITTKERTTWNAKATTDYVDSKVDAIVDSAPTALNTLNKLSKALGNDKDFATNVTKSIAEKAKQSDLDEHTDDTTVHITSAERTAWNNKVNQSAFDEHNNNTVKHITSSERTKWNNKSDFSGSYNDLTNAPNITPENEDNSLIITDGSGNKIAKFDSDGFETTKLTVNTIVLKGTDVEARLNELEDKVEDGFVAVTKAQIDTLFK